MNTYSYDEFKKTDAYKTFISENSGIGKIKIRATAARGALPVSGVNVVISKIIEDYNVVFYEGITDESGMISCISLPVPSIDLKDDLVIPPSSIYVLDIKDNDISSSYDIRVYDGICTMQNISVVPKTGGDL